MGLVVVNFFCGVILSKQHHNKILAPFPTMPGTYEKDKPWDTDDIDKWKVHGALRNNPANRTDNHRSRNSNREIMWAVRQVKDLDIRERC